MNEEFYKIEEQDLKLLTPQQAWYYRSVPVRKDGNLIFCSDKSSKEIMRVQEELEVLLGLDIPVRTVSDSFLTKLLNSYYLIQEEANETDSSTPVDYLDYIIKEAMRLRSSDIHIEIYEERCRVRIRIDGMMVERGHLHKRDYPSIINKIKIMASLDIAEKRLPQDGRIQFKNTQQAFDIRVSTLPTLYGEKIVLRLLNRDIHNISLDNLGFLKSDEKKYREAVNRPNGIVLISGPTGSGKTTTLYATLKLLNQTTRNILTIEDPIEYTLDGINQVALRENIGLSFAATLKTFMRQDPDIIMIGEIRDQDTASMAIRAALTGHLVLSTIHTNSAWGIVSRMIDMGVPSFLLSNTLNAVVAQRLIRLLCSDCKIRSNESSSKNHFTPIGCEKCYYTGYKDRIAIYEVILIDNELRKFIQNNETDISALVKTKGITLLSDNAFDLFNRGLTSLDEIKAYIYE